MTIVLITAGGLLICVAVIVAGWERIKLLARNSTAYWQDGLALLIGALGLAVVFLGFGQALQQRSSRPIRSAMPDEIVSILDDVVESGVILDREAEQLNEWLNDCVRPRAVRLKRELVALSAQTPTKALEKIVRGEKLNTADKLSIYRLLALDGVEGTFFNGDFGESLASVDAAPIGDDVYYTLLNAAEGQDVSFRRRRIIQSILDADAVQARVLSPRPLARDEAWPGADSVIDPSPPAAPIVPPAAPIMSPAPGANNDPAASHWIRPRFRA